MTVRRFILVATVTVIGLLLELPAIHAYVVGVTHILQNFGSRSPQTARSAAPAGTSK